jgi:hypothetical protein
MPDIHSQELLTIKTRRLQLLELRQAHEGLHTAPEIVMEIEILRAELQQLRAHAQQHIIRPLRLDTERPAQFPGLLALVSPKRVDQPVEQSAAFAAIDYHRHTLQRCWLIASSGEHGSLAAAVKLQTFCAQREITAEIWQVADALDVQETYTLVDWLYTHAVPSSGLTEQQVITDITGAVKPMTIGALLACRGRRPAQYMAYQPQGMSQPLLLRLSSTEDRQAEPSQE